MKSKWSAIVGVAALMAVFAGQSAPAQDGASAKFKGHVNNFWEAQGWQNHAQDYSRTMYYSQQIQPAASPAVVEKQAATVKEDLAKSDEALKAVKAAHSKDPEAVKLVDSILKHHANAAAHCNMVQECCKKSEGPGKIADCCVDIHDELEAAKAEMAKLKKHLKIEELPIPKKQAAKK
ncbi:MAG: hypothetical protein U0941_28955 [Planctomycetaceae bacterium]